MTDPLSRLLVGLGDDLSAERLDPAVLRRRGARRTQRMQVTGALVLVLVLVSAVLLVRRPGGSAPATLAGQPLQAAQLLTPQDLLPALGPWQESGTEGVSRCGPIAVGTPADQLRRDFQGHKDGTDAIELVLRFDTTGQAEAATKAFGAAYDECVATHPGTVRLRVREAAKDGYRTLRFNTDLQGRGDLEYAGWTQRGVDVVVLVVHYYGRGDLFGRVVLGEPLHRAGQRLTGGTPGPWPTGPTAEPVPS